MLPYPACFDRDVMGDTEGPDRVRLDKWLWAARFFKTRALASEAIDGGRVEVNDERAKRSKLVQVGDRVRVRRPPSEQIVVVRGVSDSRGPAPVAALLYEESAASIAAREALSAQFKALGPPAFRDKGRPSKKERRDIGRWKGKE